RSHAGGFANLTELPRASLCLVQAISLARLTYYYLNPKGGTPMKLQEFLRAEMDREIERSRRALEQAPEGKYDWKPHDKSMIFGYLANMVATIPMWITMQINQDELDVAPKDGGKFEQKRLGSSGGRIEALDKAV